MRLRWSVICVLESVFYEHWGASLSFFAKRWQFCTNTAIPAYTTEHWRKKNGFEKETCR